jgi:two-component system response regulator DesR
MRILIADDNERVRRGVIGMISSEADWSVCGEAVDGGDALRKAQGLLPDLILLDINMPGLCGLEASRLLRQEVPKARIVIMSQHDPIQLLPRALEAGAHACVDKSDLASELLPTIKRVCADQVEPRAGAGDENLGLEGTETVRTKAAFACLD